MEQGEREKLVRFVEFMLAEPGAYFILCGEKETFFDWYRVFQGMQISSLYELKAWRGRLTGDLSAPKGRRTRTSRSAELRGRPPTWTTRCAGPLHGLEDDGLCWPSSCPSLSMFRAPSWKRYSVDDTPQRNRRLPRTDSLAGLFVEGAAGSSRSTETSTSPSPTGYSGSLSGAS